MLSDDFEREDDDFISVHYSRIKKGESQGNNVTLEL
jgi:hypothetical protein